MTIRWEEQVFHAGAPFAIFLSKQNDDTFGCLLLDHIPHNDAQRPTPTVPFVPYAITVNIPDIKCDKCSLSIYNPMTDKLPIVGLNQCTYIPNSDRPVWDGTCFSVYHSCANLRILGSQPFTSAEQCTQPSGWPYADKPNFLYSVGEQAQWQGGWLVNAPPAYRLPAGKCANTTLTK